MLKPPLVVGGIKWFGIEWQTINQQPNMPKIVLEKIVIERFYAPSLKRNGWFRT